MSQKKLLVINSEVNRQPMITEGALVKIKTEIRTHDKTLKAFASIWLGITIN